MASIWAKQSTVEATETVEAAGGGGGGRRQKKLFGISNFKLTTGLQKFISCVYLCQTLTTDRDVHFGRNGRTINPRFGKERFGDWLCGRETRKQQCYYQLRTVHWSSTGNWSFNQSSVGRQVTVSIEVRPHRGCGRESVPVLVFRPGKS